MQRTPLSPTNRPQPAPHTSKLTKCAGLVKVAPDDELLFKAVAANPTFMNALGESSGRGANAAASGARALRVCGYGHDGHGNATYAPPAGSIEAVASAAQQQQSDDRRWFYAQLGAGTWHVPT